MSEWISVEDRLPESHEDVLGFTSSRTYWICRFSLKNETWLKNMDLTRIYSVTHWMPLPKPPSNKT